jgi:hypothetical protein
METKRASERILSAGWKSINQIVNQISMGEEDSGFINWIHENSAQDVLFPLSRRRVPFLLKWKKKFATENASLI